LIWGDKKYVLPSLLPEFAGKVNLIYIDPPFNVGSDFSFTATIADSPDPEEDEETTSFVKQPSIIEQKAYRDTWGKGLDSYMQWFYETVLLLKELLAEDGSIYVHLDWHVGHYAKTILDEVFGYENFRNEVVWKRATSGSVKARAKRFGANHDVILKTGNISNIFFGVGVVLALGGGVSLRSGGGEDVGGTGHLPSIAQGAFFFWATHDLAQKPTFLPSFGRAKEKKKVFRDERWAITPLAGH
jgi:hypothetical protein